MRVLITGSRDWPYPSLIVDQLLKLERQSLGRGPDAEPSYLMELVHGAARGADRTAAEWAGPRGWTLQPFAVLPEDWQRVGKGAGHMRNSAMVKSGADICLAFWYNYSSGTRDCISKARAAGIPTKVFCNPRVVTRRGRRVIVWG